MVLRKIVKIDEEKCTGCGECIPNCAEGALKIIDGKAKIVDDIYCDGLGACLGHCPEDAISVIEREAPEFDEEAVHEYLAQQKQAEPETLACGCPSSQVQVLTPKQAETTEAAPVSSSLRQWPVQLNLVPIKAPYFQDANLLIMADCVPVAYPELHQKLLKNKSVMIGCPKFDNGQAYVAKLTEILKQNNIQSMTVATMEVPCCNGLQRISELALQASGKLIPTQRLRVSVNGDIEQI